MIVRITPHRLDAGVRNAVDLLNAIDGVATRASCEGRGAATRHPHSTLAYVTFEYPLPLRLQAFLVAQLGALGRVDDDRIYCRWPGENKRFLTLLSDASERYASFNADPPIGSVAVRLTELRSRLQARGVVGKEIVVSVCASCAVLAVGAHDCGTLQRDLLHWPTGQSEVWFADFLAQVDNRLEPTLLGQLGAVELEERTRRGAFGAAYRRRWLRYHNARAQQQIVSALGDGVRALRAAGGDFDLVFAAGSARIIWRDEGGGLKP